MDGSVASHARLLEQSRTRGSPERADGEGNDTLSQLVTQADATSPGLSSPVKFVDREVTRIVHRDVTRVFDRAAIREMISEIKDEVSAR